MIGSIRKHQKWLWIVIIFVVIVTFVVFFSPNARMGGLGGGGQNFDYGKINGEPITARQHHDARIEESLAFFLTYGEWPSQEERLRQMGFDLENNTYRRLLIDAKARQYNIYVNEDAIVAAIKNMFGIEPGKALPVDEYNKFISRLTQNGASQADFERFVAHQVAQQQLVSTFGLGGKLITPKEIEALYTRENQPIVAEIVRFNFSNYVSQVTSTPKDIESFFTNNSSAYRIPERVEVNYVKFEITNFLAEADKTITGLTNFNDIVNKTYFQKGADSFKSDDGKTLSADEAKAKIRNEFRTEIASKAAQRKAIDFLTKIYNKYTDENPYKPAAFADIAKEDGLKVQTTEPFDSIKGPSLKLSREEARDFVQHAFRLSEDPADKSKKTLLCTTPIATENGIYAISLQSRLPSQARPLSQVRADVEKDYAREKAYELASVSGERFESILTNGVAAGKAFSAICAEAKVKAETLTPFSLATKAPETMDKSEFEQIQNTAYSLATGKASRLVPTRYGGFVVYIKERQAVDKAKMASELPTFAARLREQRQGAAFGEWLQQQATVDLSRPAPAATAKSKG